jgi:hypothetical protein
MFGRPHKDAPRQRGRGTSDRAHALQNPGRIFPNPEVTNVNREEFLVSDDDRTVVRVAGVTLDTVLREAITTYILLIANPQLSDTEVRTVFISGNGVFAAFSVKIQIAYILGLYDKTVRDDLNTMLHIRDAFAHAVFPVDFDTEEVVFECSKLITLTDHDIAKANTSRLRFISCFFNVLEKIHHRFHVTAEVAKSVIGTRGFVAAGTD